MSRGRRRQHLEPADLPRPAANTPAKICRFTESWKFNTQQIPCVRPGGAGPGIQSLDSLSTPCESHARKRFRGQTTAKESVRWRGTAVALCLCVQGAAVKLAFIGCCAAHVGRTPDVLSSPCARGPLRHVPADTPRGDEAGARDHSPSTPAAPDVAARPWHTVKHLASLSATAPSPLSFCQGHAPNCSTAPVPAAPRSPQPHITTDPARRFLPTGTTVHRTVSARARAPGQQSHRVREPEAVRPQEDPPGASAP